MNPSKAGDVASEFAVGDRVIDDRRAKATVRYVGRVGETRGDWIGVEWDDEGRGKHDGTHQGKRYFATEKTTAGSFVRPAKISAGISLMEAVRQR